MIDKVALEGIYLYVKVCYIIGYVFESFSILNYWGIGNNELVIYISNFYFGEDE